MSYSIYGLTEQHAIPGAVEFVAGAGRLTNVKLTSSQGGALVSLYGGQVLGYRPAGAATDVLFLGDHAVFKTGKAIRGGVPVCWPWFGPDPEGSQRPNHGFARTSLCRVIATEVDSADRTRITLGLSDDAASRDIWPHSFDLQLVVTLDDTLTLELISRNTGSDAFTISQALHTYFSVGDIDAIEVAGLEDRQYLDKADEGRLKRQQGAVRFGAEVNRIYTGVSEPLVIRDASLKRSIEITASGGTTAIVWNPWRETSSRMADLGDTDYRRFVCVETANAGEELVDLLPGGEHCLTACYRVETFS